MRVLICGSRTYEDPHQLIHAVLSGLADWGQPTMRSEVVVIEGEAQGADSIAARAADHWGLRLEPYPADWQKNGRAAGPIRNQQMLDEGKPDMVLAFVDKPLQDSVGTYDMVKRARKANVPTYLIWRM